jgi:hypothetical protein
LIAPVALDGLDPVGREDLAGVEGNDRDLRLVDDASTRRRTNAAWKVWIAPSWSGA